MRNKKEASHVIFPFKKAGSGKDVFKASRVVSNLLSPWGWL